MWTVAYMQKSFMANRKALSSSRQAMNAVQPISTYEVLELFYLYWLQNMLCHIKIIPHVLELFYLYWLQNYIKKREKLLAVLELFYLYWLQNEGKRIPDKDIVLELFLCTATKHRGI